MKLNHITFLFKYKKKKFKFGGFEYNQISTSSILFNVIISKIPLNSNLNTASIR